jgi:hypothetical protein
MELKLGLCREKVRYTWEVLKCCAGEGWRRSVGPVVREMKFYEESRRRRTSYIQ